MNWVNSFPISEHGRPEHFLAKPDCPNYYTCHFYSKPCSLSEKLSEYQCSLSEKNLILELIKSRCLRSENLFLQQRFRWLNQYISGKTAASNSLSTVPSERVRSGD